MSSSPAPSLPRAKAVFADFAGPSRGVRVSSNRRNRPMESNCSPHSSSAPSGDHSSGSSRPTLSSRAYLVKSYQSAGTTSSPPRVKDKSLPGSHRSAPTETPIGILTSSPPTLRCHVIGHSANACNKGPKKQPHTAPAGPDFGSPFEETVVVEKQQPYSATPPSSDRKRSKIAAAVPLGSKKSTTPKLVQLPEDGDPPDVEPLKRFPASFSFVDVHDSLVGWPLRLVAGLASLCRFSASLDLFLSRLQAGSAASDIASLLLAFYSLCFVLALWESIPLALYVFLSLFPFLVFSHAGF
ncbi:hypothetical protein NC653_037886 [Populus alba x Populus x berolinensis]|uniref:Uncharacterized protein n=1 Tax=Populus alba x Populus x berolinensis TaxID=444605 RepID=A0AAD6LGW1_9ROSI|nr:hypothetical protein NC653_037886 [Populus alba x Populus x berolinensis]